MASAEQVEHKPEQHVPPMAADTGAAAEKAETAHGPVARQRLAVMAYGTRALVLRGWARVPAHWRYILAVFVVAKVVLTLVGLLVIYAYLPVQGSLLPHQEITYGDMQRAEVSSHPAVWLWFSWDSFIYFFLARIPITEDWQAFSFPLLYPFLGRGLAVLLGGNVTIALLIVSNVAFVATLYYAYRLGETLLGDEAAARRFTRYIALLPTAFLFQAALTESLFLALALATLYYAERGKWIAAGVFGYFLALSRSVGFAVAVCLVLVLLRNGRYKLNPSMLWTYVRTGWPIALLPLGWFTFMLYCWLLSGDWFAYQHAQEKGWGINIQSPIATAWNALTVGGWTHSVRVIVALVVLGVVVVAAFRWLRPAYVAYGLLMTLIPLSMGPPVYGSLLRYLVVVFPVALVLAQWARRPAVDTVLSSALPVVQGALFVTWITYWAHFII